MVDRLVLGSGGLVHTVVESLEDRPGSVQVLTDEEGRAKTLRENGIPVFDGDPTREESLDQFDGIDVVLTLAESQQENLDAARVARRVFPDAYLLAYAGDDATDHGAQLAEIADRVIDPGRVMATYVTDRAGDSGQRMRQLWTILHGIESLAVVSHDNPDPDAIASGVALARLAEAAGCDAAVCYFGSINHQENRAFVNVLDLDLRNVDSPDELDEFDGLALVDHSRPGVNDQLPEDAEVDVVIDHHPPRAPIEAGFVDLRSDVGATSTLLVDYLDQFGLLAGGSVATALLFGIHVDTKGFSRDLSQRDFRAAAALIPHTDLGTLERIESPSLSPATLETLGDAIRNRHVEGGVLLTCVGRLFDRDALAQAADRLLGLEGVTTTVVYGFTGEMIYVSARSRGADIDLGETLRNAFDQIGSAGGHVDMAGAQIELGVLESVEGNEESVRKVVEEVIQNRFFEAVDAHATGTTASVYTPDVAEEYLEPDAESSHPDSAGDQ
jgi:nanoRNase/pAp phosphatase (c-di-AMP/oligoRNAs hydrolase)